MEEGRGGKTGMKGVEGGGERREGEREGGGDKNRGRQRKRKER